MRKHSLMTKVEPRLMVRLIEANSVTGIMGFLTQNKLHLFFALSLWFKAILAIPEVVAGIAAFVVSHRTLLTCLLWITTNGFGEDPRDFLAALFLRALQHVSVGEQRFVAVYLLGHGAIKLWLIAGLLREKLWYFPVSLSVFSLLIAYQLYRYTSTHTIWLLLITGLDLVVIALTWHEYRELRANKEARAMCS